MQDLTDAQLFDLNKRGTIIIATMRSGSHFVKTLLNCRLRVLNIPIVDNDEYFSNIETRKIMSFSNVVDLLREQTVSNRNYSTGTIVYPRVLDMITHNSKALAWLDYNYHLIKLCRRDYVNQFMSMCIFNYTRKQYGFSNFDKLNMPIPYTPELADLNGFITNILEHSRFPCANTIYYEDLQHKTVLDENETVAKTVAKNNYGITPADFFANYDEIKETLSILEPHVG